MRSLEHKGRIPMTARSTDEAVAWRYRYLHKGDGSDHWIVRQTPMLSSEASQGNVAVEVEPLYTRHESEALTVMREALEKIAGCDSHHPNDVVAVAREALARIGRS
jgi:hypothetical protein